MGKVLGAAGMGEAFAVTTQCHSRVPHSLLGKSRALS